jgi:hypothetical protein
LSSGNGRSQPPSTGGGRAFSAGDKLQAPFEGGTPAADGHSESHVQRLPSPLGQCFAPYGPSLVAAQKACEREVHTMFSNGHVVNMAFSFSGDIITDPIFMDSQTAVGHSYSNGSPIPPSFFSHTKRGVFAAVSGRQTRVHTAQGAPAPLIDPCLGSDEHFQTATAGTYFPRSRHTYPQLMRSCGSLLAFLRATCMISGTFVNAEGTFSLRWQPGVNPVLDFCGPSRNRTSTQWQELSTYS